MLSAPMTGGGALVLKYLRNSGELVNEGDVVAEFDTTEQAYALREAEADLAEADQQVAQATAENQAKEEEDRLRAGHRPSPMSAGGTGNAKESAGGAD